MTDYTDASETVTETTDYRAVPRTPPPRSEYEVPDEAVAETCPECERPFPNEELLALHRDLDHEEMLAESEQETVTSAQDTETQRLRLFRLKALAVLVVLYFGLLMVYAVVA